MSDTVIEAQGLTKRYGRVAAVDDISFTVGRGEIFGLLGPNGAGKTTTILMMLGLTEVTAGTVSVLGHDPAREPLQVKRQVGYLPDTVGFYDHMTARRQSALHRGPDRHSSAAERDKRIIAALDRVGLGDVGIKRVGDLLARHAAAARPCRNPDEGRVRSRSSTSRPPASIRMRPASCWKSSARSSVTASRCCCRRICWSACRACATASRCSTPGASR